MIKTYTVTCDPLRLAILHELRVPAGLERVDDLTLIKIVFEAGMQAEREILIRLAEDERSAA